MTLPKEYPGGMTATVLVTFNDGTTGQAFYDYNVKKWFIKGGGNKTVINWEKLH